METKSIREAVDGFVFINSIKEVDGLLIVITFFLGLLLIGMSFTMARASGIIDGEKRVLIGKSDLEMKINYRLDIQLGDSVYLPVDTIFLEKK